MSDEELRNRFDRSSPVRPVRGRDAATIRLSDSSRAVETVPTRPEVAPVAPSTHTPRHTSRAANINKRTIFAIIAIIIAIAAIAGGYSVLKPKHTKSGATPTFTLPAGQQVSIPLYYPQNLPSGYTYNNDAKVIRPNVLYISVTGPGNQVFYVTQQTIPANFDFVGFGKKFTSPDNFTSDAGSAMAGQVGANLIGSIQTNKNTWIIINSPATNSLTELEIIARSFEYSH